eukprot:scaffold12284_cov136-Isochrysis_galbana.AAC.4
MHLDIEYASQRLAPLWCPTCCVPLTSFTPKETFGTSVPIYRASSINLSRIDPRSSLAALVRISTRVDPPFSLALIASARPQTVHSNAPALPPDGAGARWSLRGSASGAGVGPWRGRRQVGRRRRWPAGHVGT